MAVTAESDTGLLSDRELAERTAKQLDHVDSMLHELRQILEDYRPLLDYARARLDPGSGWRRGRNGGRASGRQ